MVIGNEVLWQLFGRMLYPNCTKYPEIEKMISVVTAQQDIEKIVLRSYMVQNPRMYTNPLAVLPTHYMQQAIAYSPDGSLLASASLDGIVSVWNAYTNQLITKKQIDRGDSIPHIAFNPDGNTLAVIIEENLYFLNPRTLEGQPLPKGINRTQVMAMAFNPINQTMAICSTDYFTYVIQIYDLPHNRELNHYTIKYLQAGNRADLVYSPDGTKISVRFLRRVLDALPRSIPPQLNCPHIIDCITNHITVIPEKCSTMKFSNDSRMLVTNKYVWDVIANTLASRLDLSGDSLTIHPYSNLVALGEERGIHIFDPNTLGSLIDTTIIPMNAGVEDLTFHPQGTILAALLFDSIHLFGYQSLRQALLATPATPDGSVASAAPSAPTQADHGSAAIATQEQEEDEPVVLADPNFDPTKPFNR